MFEYDFCTLHNFISGYSGVASLKRTLFSLDLLAEEYASLDL
jgi:hypothetical protein